MSEAAVNWVDVFSALLTPTIGIIAVLIAYQQYRINHLRLKHELYEARLRVYQAVQGFLSEIFRNGKAEDVRCIQFYREASEAVFLFDDSVQAYIDTLYESAIELAALQEKLYPADGSNGVTGEERGQAAKEKTELLKWFYRQLKESKKMFSSMCVSRSWPNKPLEATLAKLARLSYALYAKGDYVVIPDDIATWLKIIGAVFTAIGSIFLAWRVKKIMQWVVYCLVAHEQSLDQVRRILNNETQTKPMVQGVTKHLLDLESKLALALLIGGFLFLATGMLATAASYLFGGPSVSA